MKRVILFWVGLGLVTAASAQTGRLIGPFNLGSGNWNTVQNGGFNTNINGWGGVGATSLMYVSHGVSPTQPSQLPYSPTTGVLRYGFHFNLNQNQTWTGWLSGSVPQNVPGQRYVLSAFVNLKGRQFFHPSETHLVQVDRGSYNYVRTANPIGGHSGWQFVYVRYTATGLLGGSFPIMIVNEFRQSFAGQEVEFDEIAVTPEAQFSPPTVTGPGRTRVSGRVNMDGVVGPVPRWAFIEMNQVGGGMRLATRVELDALGNFTFDVGNYGMATFNLRVKPDTGLRLETQGQFVLDGNAVSFPILNCTNGDINGDNEMGPADFTVLAEAFGSFARESRYRVEADLDGNEEVGPGDFAILAADFGEFGD